MKKQSEGQPPQPTRSLDQFDILLGEWTIVGNHPMMSYSIHGHSSFEWLKEGALLVWRSDWEPDQPVPSGYSIIGHDDTVDVCTVLYTDIRGVARIYQMSLVDGIWKMWRDSADFSQRMTGTFSDNNRTITCKGELSRDGSTWEPDLSVTFTRKSSSS